MDLLAFQKSRDKEFSDFESEQNILKQKYQSLISSAVSEIDPQEQSTLVEAILEVNKELSAQVRDFVSKQHQGVPYDEKSVLNLTNELIKYQKEYDSIRSATDRVTTLKMILNEDKDKVSYLRTQFNILLGVIGFSIAIIVFMIFTGTGSLSTPLATPQ
jgi:hypothetical protein